MTSSDIAKARLHNQQVACSGVSTAQELLTHMGALQAQDYQMVKWAIGVRLPGATLADIEAAIAQGDIVRTHVLRPTWHFVSAGDLRWLLALTAPRIKVAMRTRHKFLELTEKAIARSNRIIGKALAGGKQLTRKKIVERLEEAGFENSDNRASPLLLGDRRRLRRLCCPFG